MNNGIPNRPAPGAAARDELLRKLHARRMASGARIDGVAPRISFAAESALDAEILDAFGDDVVDLVRRRIVDGSPFRLSYDEPQRWVEDLFLRRRGLD